MEGNRATTAPEPRSWGELVSSYARNRDNPERRAELQTAAGQRRKKIPSVTDRNPILNEFKNEQREQARAQKEQLESKKWDEKRLNNTMKSRHFDILSNRFLGFPPQKHEDVKPLVSIVDLQKAERMDKPHHQTDYNILAPTTDPNAKRKVFVMPFESMAKREFDMLSNDYYKDNQQKQERDFQTAVVKGTRKPTAWHPVLSQYWNPDVDQECRVAEHQAEQAKRQLHADRKPPFFHKAPQRLYDITSQDVIKDPEAYATQQIVWNQQHQTFLNKYSRSGQIKSVCDGADALQEERYRNRFREERVARSTDYDPLNLRDYHIDPPAPHYMQHRPTAVERMQLDDGSHAQTATIHHTHGDTHATAPLSPQQKARAYPLDVPNHFQTTHSLVYTHNPDHLSPAHGTHSIANRDTEKHLPKYLQKIRVQTSKVAGVQPNFTRPHSAARVLGTTMMSAE